MVVLTRHPPPLVLGSCLDGIQVLLYSHQERVYLFIHYVWVELAVPEKNSWVHWVLSSLLVCLDSPWLPTGLRDISVPGVMSELFSTSVTPLRKFSVVHLRLVSFSSTHLPVLRLLKPYLEPVLLVHLLHTGPRAPGWMTLPFQAAFSQFLIPSSHLGMLFSWFFLLVRIFIPKDS